MNKTTCKHGNKKNDRKQHFKLKDIEKLQLNQQINVNVARFEIEVSHKKTNVTSQKTFFVWGMQNTYEKI